MLPCASWIGPQLLGVCAPAQEPAKITSPQPTCSKLFTRTPTASIKRHEPPSCDAPSAAKLARMSRRSTTRTTSKGTPPRLLVRSSAIHAAGCYTMDPIRSGQIVAEYDGPRIPKSEADERYGGRPVTYLFGFGEKDMVIDGFSTAMFMNHSCDANCETEEIDERIFITALRDIAPGEELVYNYHLYDSDLEDEAPCYCGANACRGTMYSEAELTRRAKLLKRKLPKPRLQTS